MATSSHASNIARSHARRIAAIKARTTKITSYTLENGFNGADCGLERFDAIVANWRTSHGATFTLNAYTQLKATIHFHSNHWVELTLAPAE